MLVLFSQSVQAVCFLAFSGNTVMGQVTLIWSVVIAVVLLIQFCQFLVWFLSWLTWKFCENSVQIIYTVSHNKFD